MAPTTTRDVVEAPKIEITLTLVLGKKYFQQVEESGDSDLSQFLLQCRQKAFDWIVNQDQMQLEYDAPNLLQRFLLVLFYFQTTRYQPWKECNPPSTSQGSAISGLCYEPHPLTGEATSDIWGDQWLSRSHECQWGGVSCLATQSGKRTVVELGLGWNWLNGPLPWEVTRLQLGRLHLKYNLLTGLLPPELLSTESSLPLEYLGLSVNQFTGAIPARWFDNLDEGPAKLTALQLYSNQLIGTLPSEVGLLPLRQLYVGRNELTGSLPTEIFSIASLETLLVDSNELTGTLPKIGLATQLGEMYLSFTSMQGTLPEEFYTGLSELNTFWGNNCNFSGTISSLLGLLTSLEWLDLSNNNFDGTIPNEIEALPKLRRFLVNGNALTGTVPVSVCYSAAFVENYGGTSEFVADCLPNAETGVPTIECAADCCTSCCDETGVCLAN
ncbi:Fibronectin leucine rich transmembrane protein 2 [Seminavis robusta]|uniref:Fibronectin leucine rich transmembrane protein 2 n=1 Tax=Seminavis robusta TaxID=568900 RepID=A0A9N8D4U1_9STRA|nr:Fibronectin leucine rich transmembrane protein 2 [Seminavis robusta]|eukprot:Sro5_g004030.1 Fibronectin leucine rich transmembrane protein 2 (441) ;mRNA; r:29251-30804